MGLAAYSVCALNRFCRCWLRADGLVGKRKPDILDDSRGRRHGRRLVDAARLDAKPVEFRP
jgi:hypothetical protein